MATKRTTIDVLVRVRDKASKPLDAMGKKAKGAADGVKQLEDQAGETDSVLQGLAGALDLLPGPLGDIARTAGDVAGGMEAMARTGTGAAASIGLVGAAIAVAGAAFVAASKNIEDAEANMAKWAESARIAADLAGTMRDNTRDLTISLGGQAGALANRNALIEQGQALFETHREQLREEIKLTKELADAQEARAGGLTDLAVRYFELFPASAAIIDALDLETRNTEQLRDKQAGLETQLANTGEGVLRFADQSEAIEGAKVGGSTGGSGARDTSQDDLRALLRELTELQRTAQGVGSFEGDIALIQGMPLVEQAEAFNALIAGTKEMTATKEAENAASERLTVQQERLAERTAELTAREADRLAVADAAARDQRIGTATGAATGNVGGLLSAAGPMGAIIGAALTIGRMGADGMTEKLDQLRADVAGFFTALPEIIGQVIPAFIEATMTEGPKILAEALVPTTTAIIGTLLRLPSLIVGSMVDGLVSALTDGQWWRGMIDAFVRAMKDIFKGLGGDKVTARGMIFNPGITAANGIRRALDNGRVNFGRS